MGLQEDTDMTRSISYVLLGMFLLALFLPATGEAGTARVRAPAGGDARLLPDDEGTIPFFPHRLEEHRRITLQNLAPDALPPGPIFLSDIENAGTWAEASWEWMDGTAQWGLNRPSFSTFVQEVGSVNPAGSIIDLGFARGGKGGMLQFGLTSVEGDGTPDASWFVDGRFGTELSFGEISGHVAVNKVNMAAVPGPGFTDATVTEFGIATRMDSPDRFFNQGVYSLEVVFDSESDVTETFTSVRMSHYNGEEARGANGELTRLIALGIDWDRLEAVLTGESFNILTFPVTAGGEYSVRSWLKLLGSVSKAYAVTFGSDSDIAGSTPASATLGASGHWGKFSVEAVVKNGFFEDGPDFIGGGGDGLASFVSMSYGLD
jgi:hypothetical protein